MRRTHAQNRGRVTWIDEQAVVPVVRDDRVGPVAVAEVDGRVVGHRVQVLLAELGREPQHVARVRLLDDLRRDRPPLGVVGRQQARPRVAAHDVRELPGQVVRVLDADVSAVASRRRHGGPSRRRGNYLPPETSRPTRRLRSTAERSRPRPRCPDRRALRARTRRTWRRRCLPRGRPTARRARRSPCLRRESPRRRPARSGRTPAAATRRRRSRSGSARAAAASRSHGSRVMLFEKLPWPRSGIPRRSRIGRRAVRGDDVLRADRLLLAAIAMPDRRGHTVAVLLDRQGLARVPNIRAELFGSPAQDRL